MIYMDNAATTKMTPVAIQDMLLSMEDVWYNPSSLYAPAQRTADALWDARVKIAACLNASPEEIIFTSGGSESDNQQFFPLPERVRRQETGILSPQLWSIMPFCIPWKSWSRRAMRLNC